jgi:hypothetical protein
MDLNKLYIFHKDTDPDRLFFAYRDNMKTFNCLCKKCMKSSFVGSSRRFSDERRTFILKCTNCKITKKLTMTTEQMDSDKFLVAAYHKSQWKRAGGEWF